MEKGPIGALPTRNICHITDEAVEGVSIRIYRGSGLDRYRGPFHG